MRLKVENKKLESKIEQICEDISEIKKTMAVNTKELEIHIEGVKLAREQNDLLREDIEKRFNHLDEEIKPIKAHVSFVKGAIWALGVAGAILIGLNELGILQKLL